VFSRLFSNLRPALRFHPDIDTKTQYEIEHAQACTSESVTSDVIIVKEPPKRDVPTVTVRQAKPRPLHTLSHSHISRCPKGFVPMTMSSYMPLDARLNCLSDSKHHVHGDPFSTKERDAQLSFACDNAALPCGSRKTWEKFAAETGSTRTSGESAQTAKFRFENESH
jgi:hypothetical protein